MKFPLISIVIATKNEESNIGNCLESIKAQSYPQNKIEIIVIDNNSTDNTKYIVRQYTNKVFDLMEGIILEGIRNFRGAQLNLGVSKAIGEIIFFPDADMTFDKDLLMEAYDKLKSFVALYVPEVICGKGLLGKIRNFERSFYNKTCIDAVRFVKREVFLKIGGFDERNIMFGPDDWDFTKTLNKKEFKLGVMEKSLFHHEEQMDWKKYLKKKSLYVDTFTNYINKWGKCDLDVKKQLGFYYRFIGVFTEKGKWKKLFFHPFLTLGMYVLRIMVGIEYLFKKYKIN